MNCNTMYCSNITMTPTNAVLIPNQAVKNLVNTGVYRLIICCNVEATENLPVLIQTDLGDIPVLCKAGNTIYANQLQKRKNYCIMYGDENDNYVEGQFVIQDRVNPRANIITQVKKK